MSLPDPNCASDVTDSVPPFTAIGPEIVLLPLSVNVPAPALVNPADPARMELIVSATLVSTVIYPVAVLAPFPISSVPPLIVVAAVARSSSAPDRIDSFPDIEMLVAAVSIFSALMIVLADDSVCADVTFTLTGFVPPDP